MPGCSLSVLMPIMLQWAAEAETYSVPMDSLSATAVQCYARSTLVDSARIDATGFFLQYENAYYFVSNRHVLSGYDQIGDSCLLGEGIMPDTICIWLRADVSPDWYRIDLPLLSQDHHPLWIEHPEGSEVDVAVLPLAELPDGMLVIPLDFGMAGREAAIMPGMEVSIIGFPLGMPSSGHYAIWKTGCVASDLVFGVDGVDGFYIDATTRKGMSGAPVVLRSYDGWLTDEGVLDMTTFVVTKFLGIFAAQYPDIELGVVYGPDCIAETISEGHLARNP